MTTVAPRELEALSGRTLLITGAGGMLGSAFREVGEMVPACRVLALDRRDLDVTRRDAVLRLAGERPDVILHCAADVNADRCERQPAVCHAVQVGGTAHVIELARATGAQVVYPQSVFIFDGSELPVTETTIPAPLSAYGRAKLEAERRLQEACPSALVVRMAGFFGGEHRDKNFVGTFCRSLFDQLSRGERRVVVGERIWQPTYTRDLAANILLLVAKGRDGVYHMGARGEATFHDVASACVEALGLQGIVSVERAPVTVPVVREIAPRPFRIVTANRRLAAEGVDRQRHWRDALAEYLASPYFQRGARAAAAGAARTQPAGA